MTNFLIIVAAIITANTISIVVSAWLMSNGGIMKWLMKRYYKMFEDLGDEELF